MPRVSLQRSAVVFLVGVAVALNLILIAAVVRLMLAGANEADWNSWVEAGRRATSGKALYQWDPGTYEFRYSPVVAYAFAVISPVGILGWRLISLSSLVLLPRRLGLAALVTIPLWLDLYAGNVMTVLFVVTALALLGGRSATAAFFCAVFLVPKPLLIPVAVWILWKRKEWRRRAVLIAGACLLAVLVTGQATEWFLSLMAGHYEIYAPFELGPARVIGWVWIPIGICLAAWLTYKQHLGYASLAASPYWLPYYLIMLLLELVPGGMSRAVSDSAVPTRNHVG